MIQVLSLSWLMKKIWRSIDQQDVTNVLSGKVELWWYNEIQEIAMTVITQCIDDLLKATLRKIRKIKKFIGVEQMRNLKGAKQINRSQVIEKHSWCQVIASAEW